MENQCFFVREFLVTTFYPYPEPTPTGPGLARVGATAEVTHTGLLYDVPQSWSAAIHSLAQNFDGIAYQARHDDQEVCYALFDRAADRLVEESRTVDLDDNWFWEIAEIYHVGLAS